MPANPPEWSQVTSLLNVLAIINALVLALMVTMYTEVECEDLPLPLTTPRAPHPYPSGDQLLAGIASAVSL